ncbi:arylsulfotransferase family protein [Nocardia sp. NBC_01327]|uniref:arylsulfotransferase family protein n=1 Tax=Nocardia sp. NBC_01327 TaxID=2903593 RepID=UPI002E127A4B|nr:arylsulfotransferase family protein [Nocardia sp. NBC_01327]
MLVSHARQSSRSALRRLPVPLAACALAAVVAATPAAADPVLPSLPFGGLSYTVKVQQPGIADGYIYYTSGVSAAALVPGLGTIAQALPGGQPANVIADRSGREIKRFTPPAGQDVSNFRSQVYQGRKVLTWWQGSTVAGHGSGVGVIADENFNVITTVDPGGAGADVHEFRLTPDGRALLTSYPQVNADLTAIGGPKDGKMFDTVAVVMDVATGKEISHWSAAEHVPLADSETPGKLGGDVYDPYHMNSISLDPSGNLVVSLRNTAAVYDIDPHTGTIRWQLGGKNPTLTASPDIEFAFQHDAEFSDASTLRLFNNNSDGLESRGPSSVEWIHIDPVAKQATLVRNQQHPEKLTTFAMGNAQALPNGNTLVSWGMVPRISEFSPSGDLVYDASLPFGSYRAYLDTWPVS